MTISMHTARKKSDWELIKAEKRNKWQKVAASTKGLATPANFISIVGAVMVMIGFAQLSHGITVLSLLFIAIGRLADVFDGYIAHRTRTKSPLGEIVDTTLDKLTIFFGLFIIVYFSLLPILFSVAIIIQSLINSLASLLSRKRGVVLHPSQYGKLATFLAWFTVISYLSFSLIKEQGGTTATSGLIATLSYLSFIFFVLVAIHSTISYLKQVAASKR